VRTVYNLKPPKQASTLSALNHQTNGHNTRERERERERERDQIFEAKKKPLAKTHTHTQEDSFDPQ
jgi:hypothetical protein